MSPSEKSEDIIYKNRKNQEIFSSLTDSQEKNEYLDMVYFEYMIFLVRVLRCVFSSKIIKG